MRSDRNKGSGHIADRPGRHLWNAQLRGSATPEQVTRRCGQNRKVRPQIRKPLSDLLKRKIAEWGVDNLRFVAFSFESCFRVAVFKRKMRLLTPEIDTTLERPWRIDKSVLHRAFRPPEHSER